VVGEVVRGRKRGEQKLQGQRGVTESTPEHDYRAIPQSNSLETTGERKGIDPMGRRIGGNQLYEKDMVRPKKKRTRAKGGEASPE